jgi:D-alanyl-D-alanine carboxypeptidase (penicillin-binding protein 5/6)
LSATSPHRRYLIDALARAEVNSRRRSKRSQFRRRRIVLAGVIGVAGCASYIAFSGGGGSGTARASAARQVGQTDRTSPTDQTGQLVPGPTVSPVVAAREVVPGPAEHLPWPATGQGAVAVMGSGLAAQSAKERSVPIASLTKMMTALIVLRDHPLAVGASGPRFRMTEADVTAWVRDSQAGDSTVPVKAGEVLSEYQLLEALLLPSGDNIADLLAGWDAGSLGAFVAKMNAEALALGLTRTHYADASGVDPHSVSTAADQAVLALSLMADPVARSIVSMPSRAFPVAGTIENFNPALGTDGIVGVKSGFTSEAQGCLVTAAYRDVGGARVLVVAASLGQPGGLYGAADTDESLLTKASAGLVRFRVIPSGGVVAEARVAWSRRAIPLVAPSMPSSIVAWPGTVVTEDVVRTAPKLWSATSNPTTTLGSLVLQSSGGLLLSRPVVAKEPIPPVPAGWSPGHT